MSSKIGARSSASELRVVAVVIVDLALLPRELPDALEQRAAHLVVGDVDLVARADLGQDQPEPDPARGDVAILGPRLLLGRAFVREAPLRALEVGRHLAPDRLELVVDQRRRQLEIVRLVRARRAERA